MKNLDKVYTLAIRLRGVLDAVDVIQGDRIPGDDQRKIDNAIFCLNEVAAEMAGALVDDLVGLQVQA